MKENHSYHMNIGGASILLVLAIFGLTVFAILSLRASYHEVKMAEKTRDSVQTYYEADAKAEEYYAQINQIIGTKESLDYQELLELLGNIENLQIDETTHILTYFVDTNYNMALQVQLKLPDQYPGRAKVHSWKMITSEQGDYSSYNDEVIWDGIFDE